MKVKEENEKAGLKLNIQKMKIMASSPIISWKTDGETMETVTDFIFLAPKSLWMVTTAMKLKETKSRLVKAMVFPVVMYGCESWSINKAEPQRINDFRLWCWRRLLRVSWTARRSNQSFQKEINPEYSVELLLLKLKLQTLATWRKSQHSGKEPDAGKDWKQKEKGVVEDGMGGWHHRWLTWMRANSRR